MPKYILPDIYYGRDLNAYIPNAPSFQYWEFVSSELAVRHGIANIPTEEEWKKIEIYAVNIAQPLRNKCGIIRISSGFRCKALNKLVGSSDTSFHITGGGCDLEPLECTLMELLEAAYLLHFSEIIAEFFPYGWVHVGYLKDDNCKMLKLKDPTHNYTPINIIELRKLYPNTKVS